MSRAVSAVPTYGLSDGWLQLPPHLISELVPPPSRERLAALTVIIDDANRTGGWSILAADGTLAPAPDLTCPPGAPDHV